MNLGAPELLIVLLIGMLLFGANRLPKLARSLGQASWEFRAGMLEGTVEDRTPPVQGGGAEPRCDAPPSTGPPAGD